MSTTAELTKIAAEAQAQTLTALKQAQDLSIRATEAAMAAFPKIEKTDAPTPQQIVESTFGFAGQVLESQKAYALRLTEVLTTPVATSSKK